MKKISYRISHRVYLLILILLLSGCSLLKAREAKDTVYVPKPKLLAKDRERAPFHSYWEIEAKKLEQEISSSPKLIISNINIEHAIKKISSKSKNGPKPKTVEEINELARYFKEKLKLAFAMNPKHRVKVIEEESVSLNENKSSLNLRIAFTEVKPTKPLVNATGTVAGFFVPGGSLVSYLGSGSVAMEGYTISKNGNVLLMQFKDREGQKTYPFSIKDYQRYAHIRIVLDDWSMQIAQIFNTMSDQKVKESIPLSINPF